MKTFEEQPRCKESRYKTAQAVIGCAEFKSGEFVSVKYMYHDNDGLAWFEIHEGQNGKLGCAVAYPAKHLTRFCL